MLNDVRIRVAKAVTVQVVKFHPVTVEVEVSALVTNGAAPSDTAAEVQLLVDQLVDQQVVAVIRDGFKWDNVESTS